MILSSKLRRTLRPKRFFTRLVIRTMVRWRRRLHMKNKIKAFDTIGVGMATVLCVVILGCYFSVMIESKSPIIRAPLDAGCSEQNGYLLLPELYYVPYRYWTWKTKIRLRRIDCLTKTSLSVGAKFVFIWEPMLEVVLLRPGDLDSTRSAILKPLKQPVGAGLIFLSWDQALQQELATLLEEPPKL